MDKVFNKILDMYPDLLECHYAGKEFLGMKFKNQFIYKAMGHSLLRLIDRDTNMVWLEAKDFDTPFEYVKMKLNLKDKSGYFYMDQDMLLPDDVCVLLYDMGIDIYVRVYSHSIPYDKKAIQRRHLINKIIND